MNRLFSDTPPILSRPAATYSRLADAFRQCGRQDLVERVSVLADRRETTPRLSIGEALLMWLEACICCLAIYNKHKCGDQTSLSTVDACMSFIWWVLLHRTSTAFIT